MLKGCNIMVADKTKVMRLLKTARGQLDAVIKMVEEDRYCMDIVHQIMAAQSILSSANKEILRAHWANCVKEAVEQGNESEKIDEIVSLLDKFTR